MSAELCINIEYFLIPYQVLKINATYILSKNFVFVYLRVSLHLLGRPVVIGETEQYTALSTRSIVLFSIVLQ